MYETVRIMQCIATKATFQLLKIADCGNCTAAHLRYQGCIEIKPY